MRGTRRSSRASTRRSTRVAVGGAADGWHGYADLLGAGPKFEPDGPTRADDPLLLYFTSGTTAKPKLVLHSHRSYPVGHLSTMYWLGLLPGDVQSERVVAGLGPSTPGAACSRRGTRARPCSSPTSRASTRAGCSTRSGRAASPRCAPPPTVWRLLIQQDLGGPGALREVCAAGEPLNPEVIDQVRAAWGLTIRDGYGQTETTAQIGNPPGQTVKPGSMGRPLPGYRISLLDTEEREAAEGAVCIALDPAPAALMQGYQADDGLVERVSGAAYRTGDVASRDDDGYLTYVGRADDIFKASDYRISPFELESVLIEHPAVAEAAVVPAPDKLRAAVPKAFVSLAAGHAPDRATALSIFLHLRRRLAPYKRIRRAGVLRAAEDHLRQDPPGRAAAA